MSSKKIPRKESNESISSMSNYSVESRSFSIDSRSYSIDSTTKYYLFITVFWFVVLSTISVVSSV